MLTPWSFWNVGDAVQVPPQEVDDLVGGDRLGSKAAAASGTKRVAAVHKVSGGAAGRVDY